MRYWCTDFDRGGGFVSGMVRPTPRGEGGILMLSADCVHVPSHAHFCLMRGLPAHAGLFSSPSP